jgi:hypothetical protein
VCCESKEKGIEPGGSFTDTAARASNQDDFLFRVVHIFLATVMPTLEEQAREQNDATLIACGWAFQDSKSSNLGATRGIALRVVPLTSGDNNSVTTRFIELFPRTAKEKWKPSHQRPRKEHQPKTI